MAIGEFFSRRKSKFHFAGLRIYRDDLPAKKVGGRRQFLQVIRYLSARHVVPCSAAAISKSRDAAVQIVLVGAFDFGGDDLADLQRTPAGEVDRAVDLRRVRLGAAF